MSNQQSPIQVKRIQYIPPIGDFQLFHNNEHYKEKLKEWGFPAKEEFLYKEKDTQETVKIKGYEIYGNTSEFNTIVIEFNDGYLTCIHPAYLKEMQQSNFGKESMWHENTNREPDNEKLEKQHEREVTAELKNAEPKKAETKKTKKEKTEKLDLPADKAHFIATVKQFAMTYNSFTEENDEVIILENVQIHQEPPIQIDYAWCSHSKTLKKLELIIGDSLEFDGKITAKKLTKGKDAPDEYNFDVKVSYKINNPSKIIRFV